jgi:hypothetical protein
VTRQYDYRTMRDQFVASDDASIREIAVAAGVPDNSMSAVRRIAREENWLELREKRKARSDDVTVARLGDKDADRRIRQMEVAENALEAINDAISKLRSDMSATKKEQDPETKQWLVVPAVRYRPAEVVQLIDRIQNLFGETAPAPGPTEERFFGLTANLDGADPAQLDVIAGLAGLARGQTTATEPRRVGDSPLPSAPGPRLD